MPNWEGGSGSGYAGGPTVEGYDDSGNRNYSGRGGVMGIGDFPSLQIAAAQSLAQQAQVQQAAVRQAAEREGLLGPANQSLLQQAQVQQGPPALGGLFSNPTSFLSELFGYQFGGTPWGTAPPGPMIGAPGNAGDYLNNPLGAVSDGSRGNIDGGGGGGAPPGTTGPAANPGFQINPNQVALDLQGGWGQYQSPQMNPMPTYNTGGQAPFSWNNYLSNFGGK